VKIVFVGFKVKQDKSVMYKKVEIEWDRIQEPMIDPTVSHYLGKPLLSAIQKDCDFVSIRFIKEDK